MADQLVFNDSLSLRDIAGTGSTVLSGTANVTYGPSITVTGSLSLTAGGTIEAQTYTNLAVTQTAIGPDGTQTYTLKASNPTTKIEVTYAGQLPAAATATVHLLSSGAALASGVCMVSAAIAGFASGTQIRTPNGDVAVENLRLGGKVITSKGDHRTIKGLSQRPIDCRRHPQPLSVMPIRIAAEAFGPSKPSRDLLVSPGSAIGVTVVQDILVPASSLVNGSTITHTQAKDVTYWHVTLDRHDVLLANGLPAESYLDMEHPGATRAPSDGAPARHCRPFTTDDLVLRVVHAHLRSRALALGWTLEVPTKTALRLEADGELLLPTIDGMTARFALAAEAKEVWLVSDTSVMAGLVDSGDTRAFGSYLAGLTINNGISNRQSVSLRDPRLGAGFHDPEGDETTLRRWTGPRARLPASLWEHCHRNFFLDVELGAHGLPRWIEPKTAAPHQPADRELRVVKSDGKDGMSKHQHERNRRAG